MELEKTNSPIDIILYPLTSI